MSINKLAIKGGQPVRKHPMPFREAFGVEEEKALLEAVNFYRENLIDPPYEGIYEKRFCDAFVKYMGGGYADAVASGTIACYIAVAALNLPSGSDVLISPVTDSGPLNGIIMQGLKPVLMDSALGSYNIGVEQFLERITPETSAVFVVHSAGEPVDIEAITREAHKRGIKVVEDCSQAPGAVCGNQKVGVFGDIAAYSTMYRKTLTAGASGGIVYSKDIDVYHQAIAYADRGRPKWKKDYNGSNPGDALFPSLNFNTDELSCAIGLASIGRIQNTIDERCRFLDKLCEKLSTESKACFPYNFHNSFSPFYFPIFVDKEKISCNKLEFANALQAEGIALSPHYDCIISSWDYAKKYMKDNFVAHHAKDVSERSFNLFLNEKYGDQEVKDIVNAITKVESAFAN
jgi:perosamine synthetase